MVAVRDSFSFRQVVPLAWRETSNAFKRSTSCSGATFRLPARSENASGGFIELLFELK